MSNLETKSIETNNTPGTRGFRKELATLRKQYGLAIGEFQRGLYYYCLSLTGDPIEAEDLYQETLLRCFVRLSEIWEGISNLKSYHYRAATNLWVNRLQRQFPDLLEDLDRVEAVALPCLEQKDVRDLAILVAAVLAPQERACFMLKDVFEYSIEEIASMMQTTEGAVKSALHRARLKIAETTKAKLTGSKRKLRASKETVDALVIALNARDLNAALQLFSKEAIGSVVGVGYEIGLDAVRNGSLGVNASYDDFVKAERFEWRGEAFIALWARVDERDSPTPNAILSVVEREGRIVEMKTYYYTPFLLEEAAIETGIPFRHDSGKLPFLDQ